MSERQRALECFVLERSRSNRDRLIAAHGYLCARGAKKFLRPGLDRADLEQVAAIGLIKAVQQYDPAFSTPFEAYAWMLIVGELMHHVRDHERIIRTPRRLRALEKQYRTTSDRLTAVLGREPTTGEIATAMSISVDTIEQIRHLRAGFVVSIESALDSPVGEFAARRDPLSLEERLCLAAAVSELGERERAIVLGVFAAGLSQGELGARLGVSQSHVSKLMKRALQKLQQRVA